MATKKDQARQQSNRLGRYLVLALVLAILAASLFAYYQSHKSFRVNALEVDATVEPNGDLHVRETREFKFRGKFTVTWIDFGSLHEFSKVDINSVVSEGRNGTTSHTPTDFDPRWREEGGPGGYTYSYDQEKQTLYTFFPPTSGKCLITVDYVIRADVLKYRDFGELRHVFLGSNWKTPTRNVNITVTLPADHGQPARASRSDDGKNADLVRAWGSGPLTGELEVDQVDRQVSAHVGKVESGQEVGLRILFPANWLSEVAQDSPQNRGIEILPEALAWEARRAEQANAQRDLILKVLGYSVAVPIGALLLMLVIKKLVAAQGRPQFQQKYWRDRPERAVADRFGLPTELHPVIVGLNRTRGEFSPKLFNANLVRLVNEGWVSLHLAGPGQWELRDARNGGKQPTDAIDRALLALLFGVVGKGDHKVTPKDFKIAASNRAEEYEKAYLKWMEEAQSQARKLGLSVRNYKFLEKLFAYAGVGTVMYAGAAIYLTFNLWGWSTLWFLITALEGLFLWGLSETKAGRPPVGVELEAGAQALENWLRDFTALEERPPTDEKIWGQYLIYATLFGLSQQVLDALTARAPESLNNEEVLRTANFLGYDGHSSSYLSSPADKFATVHRQNAVAVATSSRSSVSGFGGGFSAGSIGGTGSGGGGGAR